MAHAMHIGRAALREQQGRSPLEIGLMAARQMKGRIDLWRNRITLRNDLACLDKRMLDDVGLDPFDVRREIQQPFWRECAIRKSDRRG